MNESLLPQLETHLASLPMPASKVEVGARLEAARAAPELRWLVAAMPGDEFHFVSDVLSTARIALEMDIGSPWPEHAVAREGYISDESLAATVRQRLLLCSETNAHLIRVEARDGTVYLDGRTPDVPRGVMATRVACGVAAGRRVVNRLQVLS